MAGTSLLGPRKVSGLFALMITGNHFTLDLTKVGDGRRVTGDLLGNQLHLTFEGAEMVASPATPGDEHPGYEHIAPPALAVGIVNISATDTAATVKLSDLGVGHPVKSARDLWKHADVGFHDGVYTADVPSHGVLLLRVSGAK